MTVRFTPLALAELDEIRAFLITRSPRGAANVEARFRQVLRMISEQPSGFQEVDGRPGIRRAPLVTYPYVVYYRIRGADVDHSHPARCATDVGRLDQDRKR